MIVFGQLFSPKIAGSFKMAAKSFSRGSATASEIQDDNHGENIEDQDNIDKISYEEIVNSNELEQTPQKRSVSLNVHMVRWGMRRDGVMT